MKYILEVNMLAIVSLVLAVAAIFLILRGTLIDTGGQMLYCLPAPVIGLTAIIAGVVANRQIRRSEGSERGSMIAGAGIIMGVISFPLFVAGWYYLATIGALAY